MYFKETVMEINRNNYETFFLLYLDRELNTEEVSDVEKFLISSAGSSSAASIPRQPASGPHRKSQTAREGAHRAIREVYPGGVVPDQAAEPNATLCRRVGAKLKQLGLPDVSDDTILRAAGRRR